MLHFEKITLEHKAAMQPFLQQDAVFSTERNFACVFVWGGHYNTQVCIEDGFCYIRAKSQEETHFRYYPPLGSGDVRKAVQKIAECEGAQTIRFFALSAAQIEQYTQLFGSAFTYEESRNSFDYVYAASALITLAGRPYSAKRNHINKFMNTYAGRWEYRNINFDTDCEQILAFQDKWCLEKEESRQTGFEHEYCAIVRLLKHHAALDLLGGILFVDGQVAAYTLASPTNAQAIDILIEKADTEINGAYPVINHQFATHNCERFAYINREEDMGIEGLRKAKLSYNPDLLIEKYTGWVTL